jgi:hypothetical protein
MTSNRELRIGAARDDARCGQGAKLARRAAERTSTGGAARNPEIHGPPSAVGRHWFGVLMRFHH